MNASADAGAARERTLLSWRRTSLGFAVNALLLLHSDAVVIQILALSALALAAGVGATSAFAFRDAMTSGWFAGRRLRAELLVLVACAFGVLDLAAIIR